jgi:hypothetical protein
MYGTRVRVTHNTITDIHRKEEAATNAAAIAMDTTLLVDAMKEGDVAMATALPKTIGALRHDSNPVSQARAAHTPPPLIVSVVQSVFEGTDLASVHVTKHLFSTKRKNLCLRKDFTYYRAFLASFQIFTIEKLLAHSIYCLAVLRNNMGYISLILQFSLPCTDELSRNCLPCEM